MIHLIIGVIVLVVTIYFIINMIVLACRVVWLCVLLAAWCVLVYVIAVLGVIIGAKKLSQVIDRWRHSRRPTTQKSWCARRASILLSADELIE